MAKNENFRSANVHLVDVDAHNGEDLSNIENINVSGLEYFRVHSKSGEGFHFYFPLSHTVNTPELFKKVYLSLTATLESLGIHPDKACKNPSRKFWGTPYVKTAIHHHGKRFDVIQAVEESLTGEGRKVLPFKKPQVVPSKNSSLTDQYFSGNVNSGRVVEDLPHIIN